MYLWNFKNIIGLDPEYKNNNFIFQWLNSCGKYLAIGTYFLSGGFMDVLLLMERPPFFVSISSIIHFFNHKP